MVNLEKVAKGGRLMPLSCLDRSEKLYFAGKPSAARRLYQREAAAPSPDHRVFMRIAMTFYEEGRHDDALEWNTRGLSLAPGCPLLLCDRGAILEAAGRPVDAIEAYQELVRLGPERIAEQTCSRGLPWSRGLVNDCLYRQAAIYRRLGEHGQAARLLTEHLKGRIYGTESVYSDDEVQTALDAALSLTG